MKALWLAGWYPNPISTTNGDFVQRYAQATALLCKVDVIHVDIVEKYALNQEIFFQVTQEKNFSETIVLCRQPAIPLIGNFIAHKKYLKLFQQQIQNYIIKNGKPDIVHVHVAKNAGLAALWMKKKFGVKYVVSEQSTMFTINEKDTYESKNILQKNSIKKIFQEASLVLPVSKGLGEAINTITPVHYTVIYNCVNTDYFFYDKSFDSKTFTFIHVSTLSHNKNPRDIIYAFILFNQQYPDSKLVIAGLITQELSRYLSRLNYSTHIIQFTGYMTYKNIAKLMQQSNCMILFSRQENMPSVISEALCCGLPVISSDVGEINEVINSKNGLLVPEYTTDSLLQSMIKIYSNYNLYNREKIAEEAKANFSFNIIAKEIFDKYKEALNINN